MTDHQSPTTLVEGDIRTRAIEIICKEAEELGYIPVDVDVFRSGNFDGDDLLLLQAVERALATQPTPEPIVTGWRPISEADRSIATVQTFPDVSITLRNSYPVWVRDDDGRTYEAVWSEGTANYWWDLEGESPVDPVEFMPHPLDPRFSEGNKP